MEQWFITRILDNPDIWPIGLLLIIVSWLLYKFDGRLAKLDSSIQMLTRIIMCLFTTLKINVPEDLEKFLDNHQEGVTTAKKDTEISQDAL